MTTAAPNMVNGCPVIMALPVRQGYGERGCWIVVVDRGPANSPDEDLTFVTWEADATGHAWWGHYDMNREDAIEDALKRWRR